MKKNVSFRVFTEQMCFQGSYEYIPIRNTFNLIRKGIPMDSSGIFDVVFTRVKETLGIEKLLQSAKRVGY